MLLVRPLATWIKLQLDPRWGEAEVVATAPPISAYGTAADVSGVIDIAAVNRMHVAAKAQLHTRVPSEQVAH